MWYDQACDNLDAEFMGAMQRLSGVEKKMEEADGIEDVSYLYFYLIGSTNVECCV